MLAHFDTALLGFGEFVGFLPGGRFLTFRVTLEMVGVVVMEVECGVMILVAGAGARVLSFRLVAGEPYRATSGLPLVGFMLSVCFAGIIHGNR
jgi:hypothetical protein